MKRIVILLFSFLLIVSSSVQYALAADNTPVFGEGYNSMASNDGKAVAVLCTVFSMLNIPFSPLLYTDDIDAADAYSYAILSKLREYDQTLYDKIAGDDYVRLEAMEDGRTAIRFLGDWAMSSTGLPGDLEGFIEFLFGDQALNGDPISCTIQTPYYVNIDGQDIIPFVVNYNSTNMPGSTSDTNYIVNRGNFIVPYDGAYMSLWQDVYNNNGSHTLKPRFEYIAEDGTTHTFTSSNNITASSRSDSTFGPVKEMKYSINNANRVFWYQSENASIASCFAYMPVITKDGKLQFWIYSYVYTGNYFPGWWNTNYIMIPLGSNRNTGVAPLRSDSGSFTLESDGIDLDEVNLQDPVVVPGDNYTTIINNYVNNQLPVSPPFTDPFTWDTGGHGNITPNQNGDGGFSFDLGNFHLPDLNIDWSFDLSWFKDKFPFSIPWDLIRFYNILNVPPETPKIEGSIPLGRYTWDIDYDLHDFDDIAALFRNVVYVAFVGGLIVMTRDFLKR